MARTEGKWKISLSSLTSKFPLPVRILRILLFIVTLPYTIPASILTLPSAGLCNLIFRLLKDYAFRNSIRFMMMLILWPILLIIYWTVAFCLLPWEWALVCAVLMVPAPVVAQEFVRLIRLEVSDLKLSSNKKLRKKNF